MIADGIFAERLPEAENGMTTEDLHDAAAMEFEQSGAAVGTADEGGEE